MQALPWLAHGAAFLLAAGLTLRIARCDTEGLLLAVHYATPWPLLAMLALVLALFWAFRRRLLAVGAFAVIGTGCAWAWIDASWKWNEPQTANAPLRFVYWNAAGPKERAPAVMDYLQELRADLIAVGECGSDEGKVAKLWNTRFPGRSVAVLRGECAVIADGSIRHANYGSLNRAGRYHVMKLTLRDHAITLILVDFDADVTRSRAPAFEKLRDVIASHRGESVLVMGDFNTPIDSPHFAMLRGPLRDAFEAAGRGPSETWPVPLPLLSLDHIWIHPSFRIVNAQLGWSGLSDHRPVIVDLEMHQ